MMIEDIRPEGCICELCSDISPNREDIRTKLEYTMLYNILSGVRLSKHLYKILFNQTL
ncbi:MAG: hypothetical protein EMLJLAPB_00703 [Candidatus Argoarchaeum ethanivorans]|uniref:Uncharacterized protein n=1 Tax=Candidatus Argoarchaeum ethanivorans TaxID=2608793 RepID=A0A811TE10_9EURY|nr:MAG: hypothetical protein EMLJLAPB_00703 [Candidatus Argoarchaeum ethanivorans]